MTQIDLNADLAEGGPCDKALLTLVSSANISCGAHAGTERDILHAIDCALRSQVRIGAHPSYPDRESMGRRSMKLPTAQLRDSIHSQLNRLSRLVQASGGSLQHVKAHGALYNDAAQDPELADELCAWIKEFDPTLAVVGLAGSYMKEAARRHGQRFYAEAFVDRAYQPDGKLLPRDQKGAVLHNAEHAIMQTLSIIQKGTVLSHCGQQVTLSADTFCIHGDNPEALQLAQSLVDRLTRSGIRVCQ
ncbi:5-oxoprolinase subunit PxpA [Pseudohongiella spirulinae]|uniref:LamB/YcsF family protein n=1 Tax=Pseudohongiella spirulinae TaxID=1249552 RepID=A0A0S2KFD1_9GAMM|nr:5-oxoprolinase subunit PxpA [Pseudohongiella spirulinae]ALO47021.1 LamB/YcsF family protein [Pseudohongiella spirulinae]